MRFLKNKPALFTAIISIILIIAVAFTFKGRTRPSAFGSVVGSAVTPVQKVFYKTGEFFRNTFNALFELRELKKENEVLEEELIKLRDENRKLYQMALENKRLRDILNFTE